MSQESFTFMGSNGQEIFSWCWRTPQKPQGIVQIFHGMAEHAQRYTEIAQYLNKESFAVYACDMRGHGRTGELSSDSCHMDPDGLQIHRRPGFIMEQIGEEVSRDSAGDPWPHLVLFLQGVHQSIMEAGFQV